MNYLEYKYLDTAYGGANNRNNVLPIDQIKRPDKKDCYVTYFRFKQDYYDHWKKTGSVSGYTGDHYSDWLYLDIDSGDLNDSHKIAKDVLLYLELEYEIDLDEIEVFFSGAKGFHVALPSEFFGFEPSARLAEIHKSIVGEVFGAFRVDQVIYEINRLFRMPNTINSKSGLHKIILSPRELLHSTIDQIKQMATTTRPIVREQAPERHNVLHAIYKDHAQTQRFVSTAARTVTRKTAITDLMMNTGEGERNESAFTFAYELRKKGMGKNEVDGLLSMWNQCHCNPMLDERELARTVDSAFRHGIKESADKLARLKFIADMEQDYMDFLRQLKTRGFSFNSFIPKLAKFVAPVTPGNVIVVEAGTGVGKTAFLQNVNFHTKIPTLYVNLETSTSVLYERYQQMANNLKAEQVKGIYQEGDRIPYDSLNHIITLDDCDVDVDDVIKYWELAQEKLGKGIPFIGIDHMGLLKAKGRSDYERVTYTANEMIKLAKKTDTIVFVLSQVSREDGGSGDKPLSVNSAKGSGAIENAATLMLGLYRPDMNREENDTRMMIQILKQRNGVSGIKAEVKYNGATHRIYEEFNK